MIWYEPSFNKAQATEALKRRRFIFSNQTLTVVMSKKINSLMYRCMFLLKCMKCIQHFEEPISVWLPVSIWIWRYLSTDMVFAINLRQRPPSLDQHIRALGYRMYPMTMLIPKKKSAFPLLSQPSSGEGSSVRSKGNRCLKIYWISSLSIYFPVI